MGEFIKNKGYLKKGTAVFKSGTQSGVSSVVDFSAFETVVSNDSTSIIKDSTYQVTLKAGRKYKITCNCHVEAFSSPTDAFVEFVLLIGGVSKTFYQASSLMVTATGVNFQRSGPITYIHTTTADETLKITVGTYGAGTSTVGGGGSVCIIEEIEAYLPVVSDLYNQFTRWQDKGPLVISTGTKGAVSFDKFFYRRLGDSMQFRLDYNQTTAGAAGSGDYLITLPDSLQINTNFVSLIKGCGVCGSAQVYNGANVEATVAIHSSTQLCIYTAGDRMGSGVAHNFSVTNFRFSASGIIPISGW